VPAKVLEDINGFRYRERMHLSYEQYLNEPVEQVTRAFLVWEMDAQRDKLESERQKINAT
jgi:hypothetical protein